MICPVCSSEMKRVVIGDIVQMECANKREKCFHEVRIMIPTDEYSKLIDHDLNMGD